MQCRPPNANLDSVCQTVFIVTGDNGCRHLSVVHSLGVLACFLVDCKINVFCWSSNYAMQINVS